MIHRTMKKMSAPTEMRVSMSLQIDDAGREIGGSTPILIVVTIACSRRVHPFMGRVVDAALCRARDVLPERPVLASAPSIS